MYSTDVVPSAKKPNFVAVKKSYWIVAVVVCIVAVLAAGGVAMAVVTHFNMNSATHEGTQLKPKVVKHQESTSSQPTPGSFVTNDQPQQAETLVGRSSILMILAKSTKEFQSTLDDYVMDIEELQAELDTLAEDLNDTLSQLNDLRGDPGKLGIGLALTGRGAKRERSGREKKINEEQAGADPEEVGQG